MIPPHCSSSEPISLLPSTSPKPGLSSNNTKLETKLSILQDAVSDQVFEFSALNGKVKDLESTLSQHISSSTSLLETHNKKFSTLEGLVVQFQKNAFQSSELSRVLKTMVTNVVSENTKLESEIKRLKSLIENQTDEVSKLNSIVNDEIPNIKSEIAKLNSLVQEEHSVTTLALKKDVGDLSLKTNKLENSFEKYSSALESVHSLLPFLVEAKRFDRSFSQNLMEHSKEKTASSSQSFVENTPILVSNSIADQTQDSSKVKVEEIGSTLSEVISPLPSYQPEVVQVTHSIEQPAVYNESSQLHNHAFTESSPSHSSHQSEERQRQMELARLYRQKTDQQIRDADFSSRSQLLEDRLSFQLDYIAWIVRNQKKFFTKLGGVVKFIEPTRGSFLDFSPDDLMVTSCCSCWDYSFAAINHPLIGKITLTLKSVGVKNAVGSLIGYFDPQKCIEKDSFRHCVGVYPQSRGISVCVDKTLDLNATRALTLGDQVVIEFSTDQVSFTTVHSGWSRTIERVDGWIFGLVIYPEHVAWSISV
ncbi:hypothetical protein RCL1_007372 [Eukaryota sp. TZLM3-RCL]